MAKTLLEGLFDDVTWMGKNSPWDLKCRRLKPGTDCARYRSFAVTFEDAIRAELGRESIERPAPPDPG